MAKQYGVSAATDERVSSSGQGVHISGYRPHQQVVGTTLDSFSGRAPGVTETCVGPV